MLQKVEIENMLRESLYSLFRDSKKRDKSSVKGIAMIPTNAKQCRVFCDGHSVWSNANFFAGDIIEVCPCRDIDKTSLYTREVRDMVFEVSPNEEYVIPMGYCQFYDIISKKHKTPNCDYEWNPIDRTIVIRALKDIKKNEILVINIEK